MKNRELYTFKCYDCHKTFRTDNPQQKVCSDCQKHRQPHKPKQKKKKKKILTFAEIFHIAEIYNKIHHKYLHYGDVVALVDQNVDRCVCCGAIVPEGRQICPKCEREVE